MTDERSLFTREQLLIESIKEWAGSGLIGDDCALLPNQQIVTSDTLVEGTHFLKGKIGWSELGWKTAAVNLSDIAAMAGRPRHLLFNVTVPEYLHSDQFRQLYQGAVECARTYKSNIVGGDLTHGPILVLSVTVLGDVHERGCLLRSGARPGDALVVTGDFGASAAGLWLIVNDKMDRIGYPRLAQAHFKPEPRLCESWSLVRQTGNRGALIDASDGLADAIVQIARASKVGLQLDLETLPIHDQMKEVARQAGLDPLDWALYGGEDYELVGALPDEIWRAWKEDNPFTKIGTVTDTGVIQLSDRKGALKLDLSRCFEQISI